MWGKWNGLWLAIARRTGIRNNAHWVGKSIVGLFPGAKAGFTRLDCVFLCISKKKGRIGKKAQGKRKGGRRKWVKERGTEQDHLDCGRELCNSGHADLPV